MFLVQSKGNSYISNVVLCDFFAGKGHDIQGTPGSSVIILEEVKQLLCERNSQIAPDKHLHLEFNDQDHNCIECLKSSTAGLCNDIRLLHDKTSFRFDSQPFAESWKGVKPVIAKKEVASLLIMDQFGVKQINEKVFNDIITITSCGILIFIASSIYKRFSEQESIKDTLPYNPQIIKHTKHTDIHRRVCDMHRQMIPEGVVYYLSPFSIERGSNVNGIIFGSHSLYGIDKFLDVAWKIDKHTGEANFNIDDDFAYNSQRVLFEEMNKPKKLTEFQENLFEYITCSSPSNQELYRFCLEAGFAIKIMKRFLDEWKKAKKINIVILDDTARRNFYLSWDNYKLPTAKVRIEVNHE